MDFAVNGIRYSTVFQRGRARLGNTEQADDRCNIGELPVIPPRLKLNLNPLRFDRSTKAQN
jgi:hypothetical protein